MLRDDYSFEDGLTSFLGIEEMVFCSELAIHASWS